MRPRPDKVRFDDLTLEQAARIVEVLRPYVSEARQARLEAALAARTRDVTVVLEDIHNEHNASAVLRSAEAFGLIEVHTVPRTVAFRLSRKVSLGTHKWLDLHRHADAPSGYAALRARGYQIWAADVHGEARRLQDLPTEGRIALVFGNEHEGLTGAAVEAADGVFKIPMPGFVESLNISVASAVAMHDVLERRRAAGTITPLSPEEVARIRATGFALSVRAAPQLLARADLPQPFMSTQAVRYYDRVPGGGVEHTVPVEEDR